MRKHEETGVSHGLQNRCFVSLDANGGFDPHVLPPTLSSSNIHIAEESKWQLQCG